MSTPVYAVERQCASKRTYGTKGEAKAAARHAERYGCGRMSAYRCPHCERFHIGHRPPGNALRAAEGYGAEESSPED